MKFAYSLLTPIVILAATSHVAAQTGSVHEPVRYVGGVSVDLTPHEGRLRPAIGASNHQVVRVNRTHPERAEGSGWTYNHAPMLAWWNDTFFVEYLSNPVDEHISPGQTLLATSKDGLNWNQPVVVFPPYEAPPGVKIPEGSSGYMMHQRMGFYVAPNGRLLLVAFYGHAENPFRTGGIGRVVREAYRDGTFGPIYFIRYSSHTSWNESNTSYPLYQRSEDAGFVQACNDLLSDHLITLQWWDEDRGLDGFYSVKEAGSAISYYERSDGKLVALWKRSRTALSTDGGRTFSKPVKVPTLTMAGGKVWGQRTDDGRYAMLYNPTAHDEHRYPLIAITSDDGIIYDDMVLVHSEVPPRRFFGRWKDFGPCYVRGIVNGNGNPPGNDLWVTYSVNKEDIWVSRVPTPVQYAADADVVDDFEGIPPGDIVPDWNIYDPVWAPVNVVEHDGNRVLRLQDKDPHDYARAVRVFQEGTQAHVSFRLSLNQIQNGRLEIDLMDRYGDRPVRLVVNSAGQLTAFDGATAIDATTLEPDRWYEIELNVNATLFGSYSLTVDGEMLVKEAALSEAVKSVERISFRTGEFRHLPIRQTINETPHDPLPGADDEVPVFSCLIDSVKASSD